MAFINLFVFSCFIFHTCGFQWLIALGCNQLEFPVRSFFLVTLQIVQIVTCGQLLTWQCVYREIDVRHFNVRFAYSRSLRLILIKP